MQVPCPRCAGLDVHEDTVVACVRCVSPPRHYETRSFATTTRGLLALAEWIGGHGVTQSFNTTTSMGWLTLNILLSFAQFEREVIAEPVRDKIRASRQKGMWMGGNVPFGYRVENRKLVVDEPNATALRSIFERFVGIGSATVLARALRDEGVVAPRLSALKS